MGGVSYVSRESNYTTLIDEQGAVSYIGKALPKSATSSPVWQIKKLTQTETLLSVVFADGNDNFDNVWDNRASLVYL